MALIHIWKVKWFATPNSDPMTYYFKDDKNIEPTFEEFYPPLPVSSYTKEEIEVADYSWEYNMCID